MSCTPLSKAAKPVWANQLTELSYLMVNVKSQSVYTNTSQNVIAVLALSDYFSSLLLTAMQKSKQTSKGLCPSPTVWYNKTKFIE